MIRGFSSLTLAVALVVSQGPGARGQESGVSSQELEARGQQLLAEAVRRLDSETAVSANLRYRVNALGHELLGAGTYLQSGAGPDRLLRLELRMQVGQRPATLQEIRGSEYYWIRRDVPPGPPTLGRVDLVQLRRGLRRPDQSAADDALPRGAWIMLGGLPRLLSALEQNFDFAAPRQEELQIAGNNGERQALPIWVLTGRWKPAQLAALSGRESAGDGNLPEQLPDGVEIVLDRTDQSLPLFPYRISYKKSAPPRTAGRAAEPSELLSLELFNVHRVGQIDRRQFLYHPGDQEVLDLTTAYIQRGGSALGLRSASRPR